MSTKVRNMLVFLVVVVAMTAATRYVMNDSTAVTMLRSPTWQQQFIAAYETWHGEVDDATRDLLIHGTALTCGLLDEDPDLPRTFDRLVDYGFSSDQATSVISGAVVYRCTEFAPLITR